MKLNKISILGVGVLALSFAGCNAPATANVANKTGNAANTVANAAGNTANTVTNAVTTNTNAAANSNATTSADGSVINIDEAGVSMTVPKGMSFSKEGGDTIVKTDDDGVDTRFTVLGEENMDKAIEDAFKEIDEYIKDSKLDSKDPKKTMQNGLEVNSWSGTGKASNGDSVKFQLAIVSIPDSPKKPLLALTYAENESMEKHSADLAKFYGSIKKQ